MPRPSRHRSLLQVCAIALLLFGLVCKPVLDLVGELHALEHAALVDQADAPGNDHEENGEEGDHMLGGHGLLHQGGGGAGWIPFAYPVLVLAAQPATGIPVIDTSPPASSTLTSPFRPPIA